ncbi:MAG: winged helix-turn-helix domain-containing protein [Alphaproteobacteria bacterium]|nr:winged helix-turn-helix domain-containing protein [Alphaproteobacteria bacterium]
MIDRLSNRDARRLFLTLHGLSEPVHRKMATADLNARIEQIGFVQVDSINTVERAHHMILHARNRTYRPKQLSQLLERDRSMFENWTHDASIIPSRYFPYWRPRFRKTAAHLQERWRKHRRPGFEAEVESVLDRISTSGPVMARELGGDQPKQAGGWWNWHPSKTALEYLWRTGALAVTRREGFQKVYDLAENVIPDEHRAHEPDDEETIEWACRSALERLGFASSGEIAGFWEAVSPAEAADWCRRNLGNGLRRVILEDADGSKPREVYANEDVFDRAAGSAEPLPTLRVLSPFDPMIRDRVRAKRLFGFDYRIEVFVPAAKRQYGYYVFPLLEGDRFVGRIDMKHQRQEDNALHVTGLWLEPGVRFGKARENALTAALDRMRRFGGADAVTFANGYLRDAK